MMKTYQKGLGIALTALILAACEIPLVISPSSSSQSSTTSSEPSSSTSIALTSITINGADDLTVPFNEPFNLRTGVTAVGNNSVDYTSNITFSSTSTAVNITTGDLDTTKTGLHAVRYQVTIGSVVSQKWRNITVSQPTSEGMLVNPDFALGTAGWDDPNVVFIADGAAMTLSTEDGALKVEVTAGANAYTPRFGQMNVPFEKDVTYEVSFRAKSSVTKAINLNVGELLSAPPWFVDFKPMQPEIRTITTSWATYSYTFTHRLDNDRGGLLFELGTVNGQAINATMYFDDIDIQETTIGEDLTPPVFSGVNSSVNVLVGATFNPLEGVTAFDLVDGDVTSDIVVEIRNSLDVVVPSVDTSAPATFTVKYSVEDVAGNEATAQTTVNVVSLAFRNENLMRNGSFNTAFGDEFTFFTQDWGSAPVVVRTQDTTAGTVSFDISNGGGDASWAIQMNQGAINLEEGETYRLSFTGSSTPGRKFSAAMISGAPDFINYNRKNGFEFGTTSSTVDYVFTFTQTTRAAVLTIELGSQEGFANGVITFEEVRLQRILANDLVTNGNFNLSGWRGFANDWEGTAFNAAVVNGEFAMNVTAANTYERWHLQIVQDNESLAGIPGTSPFLDLAPSTTYELKFDAYASQTGVTFTPNIFSQGIWSNYVAEANATLTTVKTTFTRTVTTPATLNDTEKLAFEFGTGLPVGVTFPLTVTIDNVSLTLAGAPVPTLYNGDFETVLGGHEFFTTTGGSMKATTGGALITVPELGGEAYMPHYFYIFPTLERGTYQVKLRLTASVARDLRFNIVLPDAGFASILPDSFVDFATTADQEVVFTLSFEVTSPLTNVKLELDFGTLGGAKVSLPGTFLLSEVLVYRNYNA
jgi:hypothetical protein